MSSKNARSMPPWSWTPCATSATVGRSVTGAPLERAHEQAVERVRGGIEREEPLDVAPAGLGEVASPLGVVAQRRERPCERVAVAFRDDDAAVRRLDHPRNLARVGADDGNAARERLDEDAAELLLPLRRAARRKREDIHPRERRRHLVVREAGDDLCPGRLELGAERPVADREQPRAGAERGTACGASATSPRAP